MAFFYLVRHGKTDFVGKMLCGDLPGIHLNEEGRKQAQKTTEYLRCFPMKAVYTSPIERAVETAQAFADQEGLEPIRVDFLKEICFGDLQGKDASFLAHQPDWQLFQEHPAGVKFPHGESVEEVAARVADGLDNLADQFGKEDRIVCVAHCDVLRLAICRAIHLPLDHFHSLTIDPASVSLLEWSKERKKLRLLNFQP